MLTNVFKKIMMLILENNIAQKGLLEAKDVNGNTYWLRNYSVGFSTNLSLVLGYTSDGIVLGTGTTAPTEDDYRLENIITSGLTASVTTNSGVEDGSPYGDINLALQNTSNAAITITEIGIIRSLYDATSFGGTSGNTHRYLIDRTVLAERVTIAAGATAIITYTLKTEVE